MNRHIALNFPERKYRFESSGWILRDAEFEKTKEFLEPYLADLHLFFMRRINAMVLQPAFDPKEEVRLRELFEELVSVKKMLAGIEGE